MEKIKQKCSELEAKIRQLEMTAKEDQQNAEMLYHMDK